MLEKPIHDNGIEPNETRAMWQKDYTHLRSICVMHEEGMREMSTHGVEPNGAIPHDGLSRQMRTTHTIEQMSASVQRAALTRARARGIKYVAIDCAPVVLECLAW